jgi:hypothetical protein
MQKYLYQVTEVVEMNGQIHGCDLNPHLLENLGHALPGVLLILLPPHIQHRGKLYKHANFKLPIIKY